MAIDERKNVFKRVTLRLSESMYKKLVYIADDRGQNYTEALRYMIMRDYDKLKRKEKREAKEGD